MDEREKKQTEILESAENTLARKPAEMKTEAGEADGHNETCKYTEVNNLIGKTRLANAYDDNQWLFDLTKE